MLQVSLLASVGGNVQKSPSSKAAALLTRGAYSQYVSTTKWRERRWRLFSTFPNVGLEKGVDMSEVVENVNDENYEDFTQAQAAIVAYGIANCEPCKAYDPILADLSLIHI